MRFRQLASISVALLTGAITTSTAPAAMIGVNFATGRAAAEVDALGSTDVAGAVSQINWNNVTGNAGSAADVVSPVAGGLVDNAGLLTTATLTAFAATNSYSVYGGTQADPTRQLLNAYLDNTNAATPTTITVSNVPAAYVASGYNLLVYVGSDGNGRTGTVAVTTPALATASYTFATAVNPFDGAYTRSTTTDLAAPAAAEYVQFDNLKSASFTFTAARGSNNVGVLGFQVVQVPEPASAGLLGLSAAALLSRRRRTSSPAV